VGVDMVDSKKEITLWNTDLNIEITYLIPNDVYDYIISLEGEVSDLIDENDVVKDAFTDLAANLSKVLNPMDEIHHN
jgi:hypothetical protein